MSGKTNKAFKKRIKQSNPQKSKTKKSDGGKMQVNRAGKNHFNAKESGEKKQKRNRRREFKMKQKDIDRFLPHS